MYTVNEMFYSLQGEGARAGSANVFVRFSGCNLACSRHNDAGFDCDTEFTSGRRLDADALAAAAVEIARHCRNVILTGGEPGLQVDAALVDALKLRDFRTIAIETNGTCELPDGITYIACSPKTAEHTLLLDRADELRYVRRAGMGIPKPKLVAEHYYLSPACGAHGEVDRADLEWCVGLVKEHPAWRLSVQQHKAWGVR